jgi:hypothetical protein
MRCAEAWKQSVSALGAGKPSATHHTSERQRKPVDAQKDG